ncbi:hypothetical protein [Streptomyces sp. NPDC000877]|uniref:hypothetical protein n=1 Tax=unclassified Streptomyces TaxID=2593676 RepID=UPI0033276056
MAQWAVEDFPLAEVAKVVDGVFAPCTEEPGVDGMPGTRVGDGGRDAVGVEILEGLEDELRGPRAQPCLDHVLVGLLRVVESYAYTTDRRTRFDDNADHRIVPGEQVVGWTEVVVQDVPGAAQFNQFSVEQHPVMERRPRRCALERLPDQTEGLQHAAFAG